MRIPKRHRLPIARSRSKAHAQAGYLMLAVMLLITVMLIGLALEAPRIAQQIKREKEEELIHRGSEYAMAIRRYYAKTHSYPVSLEQLENTNTLRFLRQRYKDPMTASGEWKLVHLGEAQSKLPTVAPGAGTVPGLTPASPFGTPSPSPTPGGAGTAPGTPGGLTGGVSTGTFPGTQAGLGAQAGGQQPFGSPLGSPLGNPQGQSGGFIIGVASTSKATSIKEFNGSNEYDQWLFVYDFKWEQLQGQNGIIIASPTSAASPGTGTPVGVPSASGTPLPGNPNPPPVATATPQSSPQ